MAGANDADLGDLVCGFGKGHGIGAAGADVGFALGVMLQHRRSRGKPVAKEGAQIGKGFGAEHRGRVKPADRQGKLPCRQSWRLICQDRGIEARFTG